MFVASATLSACGSEGTKCESPNGACIEITPGADAQQRIQEAFITAVPGDVVYIKAGRYDLALDLTLDVDGVTVKGDGMDRTILSFAGQTEGAQGILVTSDDVTIEDLAIEDMKGDGIKFDGSNGVTVRRVRAEWTNGPDETNGGYGIYPVGSMNVLIEECRARGAADTGIYIGQSKNIIARNNYAWENVAGIEIENSQDADVYGNECVGNSAGILVFNLPGLEVKDGRRIRVFDNHLHDNNEPNFAPEGNIVGKVPGGTGFATISTREVEFFGNLVENNNTANFAVVSYQITMLEWTDPEFDPYPETIYAYDNTFVGGGTEPQGELGFYLLQSLQLADPSATVIPDMVIDGFVNPDHVVDGQLAPEYRFCMQNNGDADFLNLDAPNDRANASLDPAPHDCEHPKLPEVVIPGVN